MKEDNMDIALHPLIGETISYKEREILHSIRQGELPSFKNWYAITTAYENNNLFYILSGTEYRNPMYHRNDAGLKLLGLAGSKKEAVELISSLVQHFLDSDSLTEMKSSLQEL